MAAVALGGVVAPLALTVVGVLVPAMSARVVTRLLRISLVLTLPIAMSAVLINVFFFPGGREVVFAVGPVTATAEGLRFAVEILARIVAFSGAITLFYLTTTPTELVVDLERRGVSPRLTFVANAAVQTVPAMAERAAAITAAQRARGLDTEGGFVRRIRGIVPLAAPVILGSLAEIEERTMALEARGFTRPGRRTLLWHPRDTRIEAAARWLLVAALAAIVVVRALGVSSF